MALFLPAGLRMRAQLRPQVLFVLCSPNEGSPGPLGPARMRGREAPQLGRLHEASAECWPAISSVRAPKSSFGEHTFGENKLKKRRDASVSHFWKPALRYAGTSLLRPLHMRYRLCHGRLVLDVLAMRSLALGNHNRVPTPPYRGGGIYTPHARVTTAASLFSFCGIVECPYVSKVEVYRHHAAR
jgi:hypothetical protein